MYPHTSHQFADGTIIPLTSTSNLVANASHEFVNVPKQIESTVFPQRVQCYCSVSTQICPLTTNLTCPLTSPSHFSLLQLCRDLKGGRLVSCPDGKERANLVLTLEECCLLRTEHQLDDTSFMKCLSTLRR